MRKSILKITTGIQLGIISLESLTLLGLIGGCENNTITLLQCLLYGLFSLVVAYVSFKFVQAIEDIIWDAEEKKHRLNIK